MSLRPSPSDSSLSWFNRLEAIRTAIPARTVWIVGAVLFTGVVFWTFKTSDVDLSSVQVDLLLLSAVIGVPVMIGIHAAEFWIFGRALDVEISPTESYRLSILAAVSSALPIPGASVVRVGLLVQKGASVRAAGLLQLRSVLLWASVGIAILGIVALAESVRGAVYVLALGVAGVLASWWTLRGLGAVRLGLLTGLKICTSVADAARYYVVLQAVGTASTFLASMANSTAGLLSSIIGIFPAGLGLREALAGVVSASLQVDSSEAITASAADRLGVTAVLFVMFLMTSRFSRGGAEVQ